MPLFKNHVKELSLITFSVYTLFLKPLMSVQIEVLVLKNLTSKERKKINKQINRGRNNFSFFHRSLGVTLWELFDNAAQPYSNLSNLDVLNQVIRERDTKLPKPQLEQPYSDRWWVTQFYILLSSKDKEIFLWVSVIYSLFLNSKCYKKQSFVYYSQRILDEHQFLKFNI